MGFNPRNDTVDIVMELIIILDWMENNLESRHKMKEMPSDALAMGINQQIEAIFQSVSSKWLVRHERGFISSQLILFFSSAKNLDH